MAEQYTTEQLLTMVRDGLLDIGYQHSLLISNYRFVDVLGASFQERQIDLAAFAQDPPSYRNSCFGIAVPHHDGSEAILAYRALGAPQILALHPDDGEIRRWRMVARGKPELIERIDPDHLRATIRDHRNEWSPEQVLRAKSISFTPGVRQLDFFDIGLIPAIDEIVQKKLDKLLQDVIATSKVVYIEHHNHEPDYRSLFRLVFRLIAAKLLADRQHEGNWTDSSAQVVIEAIENFYFQNTQPEPVLSDKIVQQVAWDKIRTAFPFWNLSVEALAYVYENTLVSPEIRRKQDTHATPPEIAEYVVQHLPFEELDQDERCVFEPFAGHAPFLIATLGRLRILLRPLDLNAKQRHDYFVRMLSGMEIDSFACEVARYSLILADYPNSNGWRIENADVFNSPKLDNYLKRARIVLCNPPYGDFNSEERQTNTSIRATNKAVEALRRVLQHPPKMLGFVLPRVFIDGQSYREVRKQVASLYNNIDLVGLPEKIFRYSKAETVLLIAYGKRTDEPRWRSASVESQDRQKFILRGEPTWQTEAPIYATQNVANPVFWHTPLHRVWNALEHLPHLEELAQVHRGIEYKVSFKANASILVSDEPRTGFRPGLLRVREGFEPYTINSFRYLNTNPELMLYKAYKLPWEAPKVIANAARISADRWVIAGAIDEQGLVCSQRFHGIWPTSKMPLEVIAALINGPVANAFVSTHRTSRGDNRVRTVRQIPVPNLTPTQIESTVSLVSEYRSYRTQWLEQPEHAAYFEQRCREIVQQIDAELLTAYNLPPRLERELLDYFAGYRRPGPVSFDRYYPTDFRPAIPWRLYISEEFRASTARRTLERLPVLNDPAISAMVEALDE
jgi:type I restriction-modification system DNA methylase subunit